MQKKLETFLPLFPNKRVFSYFVLEESGECLISIFFLIPNVKNITEIRAKIICFLT